MTHWIALVIALVLNAAANILLKVGAVGAGGAGGAGAAGAAGGPAEAGGFVTRVLQFLNLATLAGIFLFAANVLVYRKALDRLDISVAYPVMVSGGLVLVTLAAVCIPVLGEKITLVQIFGMLLIVAGVWLVAA